MLHGLCMGYYIPSSLVSASRALLLALPTEKPITILGPRTLSLHFWSTMHSWLGCENRAALWQCLLRLGTKGYGSRRAHLIGVRHKDLLIAESSFKSDHLCVKTLIVF
jgi:hypothetical protein